ncbi:hypothetical protein [Halorientalis salina]|uniref:hypothetical protein n=1 Tax=Halorientalis salina TaxID=2932266 RepID=UPI0010ABFF5E|nr:hypothetical protein [Halorientalis salina]
MVTFRTTHTLRRELAGALLAGLFVSGVLLAFTLAQAAVAGDLPAIGRNLFVVLGSGVFSLAWYAPFFLAVVLVVGRGATRRTLAAGVALVYVAHLALAVVQGRFGPAFYTLTPRVLAEPLPQVARFLGIAVAYWIAYDGGYESITLEAPAHPLFAVVTDERLAPDLEVGRGVVAAALAGLIAVTGSLAAHAVQEALAGSARFAVPVAVSTAGIPVEQAPTEWVFDTTFVLAVLFVIGPKTTPRTVLKGLGVVFGVGAAVRVAPALLPPSRPLELWDPSGPLLAPIGDAVFLLGIALAVWFALRGGVERVRSRDSGRPAPE